MIMKLIFLILWILMKFYCNPIVLIFVFVFIIAFGRMYAAYKKANGSESIKHYFLR